MLYKFDAELNIIHVDIAENAISKKTYVINRINVFLKNIAYMLYFLILL